MKISNFKLCLRLYEDLCNVFSERQTEIRVQLDVGITKNVVETALDTVGPEQGNTTGILSQTHEWVDILVVEVLHLYSFIVKW